MELNEKYIKLSTVAAMGSICCSLPSFNINSGSVVEKIFRI